jgi:hypothetical protein
MLPRQNLSVSNFTDLPITHCVGMLRRALQKEPAMASGHRLVSWEWLAIVALLAPNAGLMTDAPIEIGLLLETCIALLATVDDSG